MEPNETATPDTAAETPEAPAFAGMLLRRPQLAAWRLASSEESRPQLNGVCLRPDGTVCATDGHCMITVTGSGLREEGYPAPAPDWSPPVIPAEGVIIPTETARQAEKNLPKKCRYAPVLESALLESLNGTVRLSSTDLDNRKVAESKPLEGPYPNFEQVIPRGEPVFRIGFNVALLKRVCETLLACGRSVTDQGVFEFHGSLAPCVIRYQGENCEQVTALIMPLRLPDPETK